MANGNGNGNVWKWVLVALWGATMAIGGKAWDLTTDKIDSNEVVATTASKKVDSLEYSVKELKLEQRVATKEQNIQLEEIAKATGAKVTIDTSMVVVDTVYISKDST